MSSNQPPLNRSELEIRLNRLAQKSLALEEGRAWFRTLNEAEAGDVLRSLAAMVQQAHPVEDEVSSAITESGVERTHTAPSLLLRSDPLKARLSKLTALRGKQSVEAFALLVLLLGIADGRRRRTACAQGCTHWWHSELANSSGEDSANDIHSERDLPRCRCRARREAAALETSVRLRRRAAALEHLAGMEELASWLLEGLTSTSGKLVLRRRPAAAVKLYRRAADRGYAAAFLNLGYCHDVGLGTRRDVEQAVSWYRKAVRAGDSAAASNLAILWREQGDARKHAYWRKRARALEGEASWKPK